jgi:hypothetical protein
MKWTKEMEDVARLLDIDPKDEEGRRILETLWTKRVGVHPEGEAEQETAGMALTDTERKSRAVGKKLSALLSEGPIKEALKLVESVMQWYDQDYERDMRRLMDDPDLYPENRTWLLHLNQLARRVEKMYFDELQEYDSESRLVETEILATLFKLFTARHGESWTCELFTQTIKEQSGEDLMPKKDAKRPRSFLTDKEIFVRAFLISGQSQGAFSKRVAEISAAIPEEQRHPFALDVPLRPRTKWRGCCARH